jgi:biopolymer transport protein ExbD
MRRPHEEDYMAGNLVAMIDVVFQLIIFFVCTTALQDQVIDQRIHLAMAPHGPVVSKKDPRTVNVDVDAQGRISIAREPLNAATLRAIISKVAAEQGVDVPIVIHGDGDAQHAAIRAVMDACSSAGITKVRFAALREKA